MIYTEREKFPSLQNNKYWSLKGNISQKVFNDVKKLGGSAQVPEIRSQLSYSIYLIDNIVAMRPPMTVYHKLCLF